jgi:hypothetical protein
MEAALVGVSVGITRRKTRFLIFPLQRWLNDYVHARVRGSNEIQTLHSIAIQPVEKFRCVRPGRACGSWLHFV